jgi:hypothetical protein
MDYLQLKYSVDKLTECLKIVPIEDRICLDNLLQKYKKEIASIEFLNQENNVFSNEEINSIKRFIRPLKEKILNEYQNKIDLIENKINEITGFNKVNKKYSEVFNRILKIAEWKEKKCRQNFNLIPSLYCIDKIRENSSVWKKVESEWSRKLNLANKMCDESFELNEALEKYNKIENIINNFNVDLELQNLIAYRCRSKNKLHQSIDLAIRESIHVEIEKQWQNYIINQ